MTFLEKNLEDIVFETDNDLLNERGLNMEGLKKRQLSIGNYGIADLITIQRFYQQNTLIITVYELKNVYAKYSMIKN